MNIKLIYNKSSFNVDILKDTPCQFLFEVAQKTFRIPIDEMMLTYEDIEIKNNSRLIFSVMNKSDPESITGNEIVTVSRRKNSKSIISSSSNFEDSIKLPLINSINNELSKQNEKIKLKKKG